eukprot:scaffold125231_cov37-Tisochrysis_lutea.AAC.1
MKLEGARSLCRCAKLICAVCGDEYFPRASGAFGYEIWLKVHPLVETVKMCDKDPKDFFVLGFDGAVRRLELDDDAVHDVEV